MIESNKNTDREKESISVQLEKLKKLEKSAKHTEATWLTIFGIGLLCSIYFIVKEMGSKNDSIWLILAEITLVTVLLIDVLVMTFPAMHIAAKNRQLIEELSVYTQYTNLTANIDYPPDLLKDLEYWKNYKLKSLFGTIGYLEDNQE